MADRPVSLDEHRGMAAQKATEKRRRRSKVKADQAALRDREEELDQALSSAPAATWREAADKARHLIKLLAATPAAQDRRRQRLIASVLDDFDRLSREAGQPSPRD